MLDHNIQYCGEDGQNLTGHIPEQPAVSNPAVSRAEGWTRSPEVPSCLGDYWTDFQGDLLLLV